MALTKVPQAVQASASNAAGGNTTSGAFTTNYGVSGVAMVTNGATGPTVACDFVIEVSSDGGTTWFEWSRQQSSKDNNAVTRFPFALALGSGADWGHYRTRFHNNTGQTVTVQADAETTTAL